MTESFLRKLILRGAFLMMEDIPPASRLAASLYIGIAPSRFNLADARIQTDRQVGAYVH